MEPKPYNYEELGYNKQFKKVDSTFAQAKETSIAYDELMKGETIDPTTYQFEGYLLGNYFIIRF